LKARNYLIQSSRQAAAKVTSLEVIIHSLVNVIGDPVGNITLDVPRCAE
jgi:hypothetical protein